MDALASSPGFLSSPRLPDHVPGRIRPQRCSLRATQPYVDWTRRLIGHDGKRRPLDLGNTLPCKPHGMALSGQAWPGAAWMLAAGAAGLRRQGGCGSQHAGRTARRRAARFDRRRGGRRSRTPPERAPSSGD